MNTVVLPNPWVNPLMLPTEREGVNLHQLTIDDAPYFFEAWQHSEDDIARYDPDVVGMYDSLEDVVESICQRGRLKMGTWDGDKFVASGVLCPDTEEGAWLLGLWTDSREVNKGYGSVTARALVIYAAQHLPILRAKAMDENTFSVRILEKEGLKRTGRKVGAFTLFELLK